MRCPAWRTAQGNPADHPVLLADLLGIKEAAELLGLGVGRNRRRQSHSKSFGTSPLDPFQARAHVPVAAMEVVPLWRRAVEADLQGHAIARQRVQRFEPPSGKQHAVGEHRGRRGGGAGGRISPMSVSRNGSPPVTKISSTPSSAASIAIRCTRSRPSARRGALGEERTQQ